MQGTQLDRLLAYRFDPVDHVYTARDTILYALGCGAGAGDLDLVYEPRLHALPTMATVLAYPGDWYARPDVPIDPQYVVHGSERIELTCDLPTAAHVQATNRIVGVQDKGPGRGALVISRREIVDAGTGARLATVIQRAFCRGDGGLGSMGEAPPAPATIPDRPADQVLQVETSARAAAIYRLMGDWNPLHIDPDFARRAGFAAPILHGLSTYGHAARAILGARPGARLRLMDCRFSAPVTPGDTLEVQVWDSADGCRFRMSGNGRTVIDNGEMTLV